MNAIHDNGGEFVLQVKKNCPELYAELMALFEGIVEDRENDPKEFEDKYGSNYSESKTTEKTGRDMNTEPPSHTVNLGEYRRGTLT